MGRHVEVGALLVILVLAATHSTRAKIFRILSVGNRRSIFALFAATLIFLKLFTFFRFPLADNFEVCIKSTYRPIGAACEKSFDYLFHSNDGVNAQGDITRIDPRIAFGTTTGNPDSVLGASHSNWNLPFQNEFPRFSELWLDRLPFSAKVGAVFSAPTGGLLPVEYVGEVSVTTDSGTVYANDYEFRKVIFIPIEPGRQEIRIDYNFSDDDSFDVPDEAPLPRGPYAHLVIGAPLQHGNVSPLQLTIRGYTVNLKDSTRIQTIEARTSKQRIPIGREKRPDIANFFGNARHSNGGFRLTVESPPSEPLLIYAILDNGQEVVLGEVRSPDWSSDERTPIVLMTTQDVLQTEIAAWYSLASSPELLRAEHRIPPSIVSKSLFRGLDLVHIALFLACLMGILYPGFAKQRRHFATSLLLAMAVGSLVWLGYGSNTSFLEWTPQSLAMTLLVLVPLVWLTHRGQRLTGLYIGTTATITSVVLAVRAFRSFTGLGEADWWGFMIFRDRPMDWFVYQGYAYQILVQQSLRAGEDVLYFMPGARYLIFLSHVIFGNNDVLIGIFLYASLIGSALYAFRQLLVWNGNKTSARLLTICVGTIFLGVTYSSLGTQLAISSSSETFAWMFIFIIAGFIVRLTTSAPTSSFLCVIGVLLGSVVFLRPNYLMVSVCFVCVCLILTKGERPFTDRQSMLLNAGWLLFGFMVIFALPLLHNVYYGESVNFFTSRADPNQTVFEPREIVRFFHDANIRAIVLEKFERFLYWHRPSRDVFLITSWMGQCVYLVTIGVVAKRRRNLLGAVAVLSTPVAYVLSAAPFGIMTIPERQFAMTTLALATASGLALVVSRGAAGHETTAESTTID
jgi:hypothetical protein